MTTEELYSADAVTRPSTAVDSPSSRMLTGYENDKKEGRPRQKLWKAPKIVDNDFPTYVYYLKPPGGYSLEVVVGLNEIAEQENVSVESFGDPFSFSYRVDVSATADGKGSMQIPSKFYIGRAFQQLACIPAEASRWFSRHHCCITWSYEDLRLGEASFFIHDLKSSNGTFLNGRRIGTDAKPSPLTDGDVIGVSMTEKGELMLGFRFRVPHLSSYVKSMQPRAWSNMDKVVPKNEAPLLLKPCRCASCRAVVWSKPAPLVSELLRTELDVFDVEEEAPAAHSPVPADYSVMMDTPTTTLSPSTDVDPSSPPDSVQSPLMPDGPASETRGLSLPTRPVDKPVVPPPPVWRRFSLPMDFGFEGKLRARSGRKGKDDEGWIPLAEEDPQGGEEVDELSKTDDQLWEKVRLSGRRQSEGQAKEERNKGRWISGRKHWPQIFRSKTAAPETFKAQKIPTRGSEEPGDVSTASGTDTDETTTLVLPPVDR